MSRSAMVLGPALILAGFLLLLSLLGLGPGYRFWPLVLLLGGAGLLALHQRNRRDAALFGGVLLALLGGFFVWIDPWDYDEHWPFFILAPALATTALWLFGKAGREARIPALVLLTLAGFNYLLAWGFFTAVLGFFADLVLVLLKVAAPILLIGIGSWILLQGRKSDPPPPAPSLPDKVEPPVPPAPEPPADPAVHEDPDSPPPAA